MHNEVTAQEIELGNRMIAEYRGAILHKSGGVDMYEFNIPPEVNGYNFYPACALYYNCSWEWLMPVVEQIESELPNKKFIIYHNTAYCPGFYVSKGVELLTKDTDKKMAIWKAVVAYIKVVKDYDVVSRIY